MFLLAFWPGSLASAIAYRRELSAIRRKWLVVLGGVSLFGGLLGAILLVRTSDTGFLRLLPWLMLVAAVVFTFAGRIQRLTHAHTTIAVMLLQFGIAIYGGYFGGGMGIMMLATLALAGMNDIHEMNGLKSLLGVAINGMAVTTFWWSGQWSGGQA